MTEQVNAQGRSRGAPRGPPFRGEDAGGVGKAGSQRHQIGLGGRCGGWLRPWGTRMGKQRVYDGAGANLGGEVALGRELVVGGDHAASGNAELRSQVAGRRNALAWQEDAGGDLGA